eukprot:m.295642 g.295642  ORF g.295642 m.295642 type:complete len:138 (-) comp55155_c0_seq8:322-735(-)
MDSSDATFTALCAAGCGFYGSAQYSGMCSQCHRKKTADVPIPAPTPVAEPAATPASVDLPPAFVSAPAFVPAVTTTPPRPAAPLEQPPAAVSLAKTPKNRCALCRQKVGLLGAFGQLPGFPAFGFAWLLNCFFFFFS